MIIVYHDEDTGLTVLGSMGSFMPNQLVAQHDGVKVWVYHAGLQKSMITEYYNRFANRNGTPLGNSIDAVVANLNTIFTTAPMVDPDNIAGGEDLIAHYILYRG